MNSYKGRCICDPIFEDFKWIGLAIALDDDLPKKPGVYVLRLALSRDENLIALRKRILEAYGIARDILKKANWRRLTKKLESKN